MFYYTRVFKTNFSGHNKFWGKCPRSNGPAREYHTKLLELLHLLQCVTAYFQLVLAWFSGETYCNTVLDLLPIARTRSVVTHATTDTRYFDCFCAFRGSNHSNHTAGQTGRPISTATFAILGCTTEMCCLRTHLCRRGWH